MTLGVGVGQGLVRSDALHAHGRGWMQPDAFLDDRVEIRKLLELGGGGEHVEARQRLGEFGLEPGEYMGIC